VEPEISNPRLAEGVRRLVEAYKPERVYLFGSTARREAGADSDFDRRLHLPASLPATNVRERRLLHAA